MGNINIVELLKDCSKGMELYSPGDVLVSESGNIVLLSHIDSENIVHYHCIIPTYGSFRIEENTNVGVGRYYDCVLANEQQKQRMYDEIKCSGYKYNQHINKLEKLVEPRFKVGDRVKTINKPYQYDITELTDTHYTLVEVKNKFKYTEQIIEDKNWELVHNKFDINTLVPFESRVLVRNKEEDIWRPAIFGCYVREKKYPYYVLGGSCWKQCIPYDCHRHLSGKTDDCDEYFKTWK